MVKETVSKSEFARLVGVSPAAVTKACSTVLSGALRGKRVDVSHPSAQKYVKQHALDQPDYSGPGIDSKYAEAVELCHSNGRYNASNIQRNLHIGHYRAKRILATMKINGLVPDTKPPTHGYVQPEPEKPKAPYVRGHVAAREKMKQGPPVEPPLNPEDELHKIPEDIRAFADMSLRELVTRFGTDTRFNDWLKSTKMIEDINEKRLKTAATRGDLVSRDLVKTGIIDTFNKVHIQLLSDGAKTIARRVTAMHAAGKSLEECEKFVVNQISSFIRPAKAKIVRVLQSV